MAALTGPRMFRGDSEGLVDALVDASLERERRAAGPPLDGYGRDLVPFDFAAHSDAGAVGGGGGGARKGGRKGGKAKGTKGGGGGGCGGCGGAEDCPPGVDLVPALPATETVYEAPHGMTYVQQTPQPAALRALDGPLEGERHPLAASGKKAKKAKQANQQQRAQYTVMVPPNGATAPQLAHVQTGVTTVVQQKGKKAKGGQQAQGHAVAQANAALPPPPGASASSPVAKPPQGAKFAAPVFQSSPMPDALPVPMFARPAGAPPVPAPQADAGMSLLAMLQKGSAGAPPPPPPQQQQQQAPPSIMEMLKKGSAQHNGHVHAPVQPQQLDLLTPAKLRAMMAQTAHQNASMDVCRQPQRGGPQQQAYVGTTH